jgi:lysophospholipase
MTPAPFASRSRRAEPTQMHLVATSGNPIPQGLVATRITARDGRALRGAHVHIRDPKATVVIVCGRGDFIERWFETIHDLMTRNFAVAIFDFRAQGGSSRRYRNHYRDGLVSFKEYDDDLASVMKQMVLPDCPPPYYALGHSTGGLVVLRALEHRNWFEKAVLSAPLLGVDSGRWPMPVARFLCRLVPAMGLGRCVLPGHAKRPFTLADFDDNPLTSDRRRFARAIATLDAAPALGLGGPTYGWLGAAFKAMDELSRIKGPGRFRAPVLIVAAGRDRVVDLGAARRFARRAALSLVVIPESRHEILLEADEIRAQFLAAFDTFIDGSAGGLGDHAERFVEEHA